MPPTRPPRSPGPPFRGAKSGGERPAYPSKRPPTDRPAYARPSNDGGRGFPAKRPFVDRRPVAPAPHRVSNQSFAGTTEEFGDRYEASHSEGFEEARNGRPTTASASYSPRTPASRKPSTAATAIRRGTLRIGDEVAIRVRAGHPLIFRDALRGRPLREPSGEVIELLDGEGRFIGRGMFDPEGIVALRLYTRDPKELIGAQLVARRVDAAIALRAPFLAQLANTNVYRLIHGEGDGLPGLAVDRYGDYLVITVFTEAVEPLLPWLYDALEARLSPKALYEQRRTRPQTGEGQRQPAKLVRGKVAPVEIEVQEAGLKFWVDVTAPLGTGLFLDLRDGRQKIAALAKGKSVLNLFSYTGAISVWAAKAGAKKVTSVDLAARAQTRARRNFELNGLDVAAHDFVTNDAFKELQRFADRGPKFDVVILDPPSFAQAKDRTFSVQKNYRELVQAALAVCEPNAVLVCVANTAKVSAEEFDRAIGEAAVRAHRDVSVVDRIGLPFDFPIPAGYAEAHYLKCAVCIVR